MNHDKFELERWMTPRDRQVVVSVYRHGIINTKQLEYMHFREHAHSKVISLRRIKKLVDNGYLAQYWFGWKKGPSIQHFTITKKGATIVALSTDIALDQIKVYERKNIQYIEHSLAIVDFHNNLLKAGLAVEHFTSDYLNKIKFDYKFEKGVMIEPDGIGIISTNSGKHLPFAMELDRGAMSYEKLLDKVIKYEKYFLSNKWEMQFDIFPLVIISTDGKHRMNKLKSLIEDKRRTKVNFLLSTIENSENKFLVVGRNSTVAL